MCFVYRAALVEARDLEMSLTSSHAGCCIPTAQDTVVCGWTVNAPLARLQALPLIYLSDMDISKF